MDTEILKRQLVEHEGNLRFPYKDKVGKLTIGVGRNLTDVGVTEAEAFMLLDNDIAVAKADLDRVLPWWTEMNDVRQRVLCDLGFNMGIARLRKFVRTLASMEAGNYKLAAKQMLESKWAGQVGKRAQRLARMMSTGEDVVLTDV